MSPDWVQACAEGAAAQRWLLYQIAFGSEKCTEKKRKLPAPVNAQREMRCTLFTAYTACYV